MDNTIIPYEDASSDSSSDLDDSSEDDEHSHLLSNNIGVHYNKFQGGEAFMNMEKHKEYESVRNKYFTPDISKIRLMIESKNISYSSDRDTSNYKVSFEDNTNNSTGGYGNFDNVIGFRLIKANVFNSIYTVNDNNRNINITVGATTTPISLEVGSYTFSELGNHLQTQINASALTGYTVTSNTTTYKYTISNTSSAFTISWPQTVSSHRLFGFNKLNKDSSVDGGVHSVTSDNVVQQSVQFVDLVIPEIPYIACKRNSVGKNLIDRIPLDCEQGSIMYYSSDINLENYFTPVNLNSLTIQLYEDTTDTLYDCQNNDNSFEFELTILNKHV
tara:strand:+ start:97 stop:1089 length:993 start_codon:yes stop_codon:yes gene_type:complete